MEVLRSILHRIRNNKFLTSYFAVAITIQAIFACLLAYTPNYDVRSVFFGAISLAETGTLPEDLTQYFAWSSNNFGITYFMYVLFKVFGAITNNYFMIVAITNIVLINLGVYFLYDTIRRVCGVKIARSVLVVLFFYVPMYFFPSMIYTDTITLCVPIICLNLFIRLQTETMSHRKSAVLCVLIGVISGFGYIIKATPAIMLIAIVITCCVFIRKKKVMISAAISIASCIVIVALFQIPYRAQIPKDVRDAHSFPYSHWVMMGLQNGGRVTWEEFATTMSFPTRAEKNANAIATIKYRLNEMGVRGFVRLMAEKTYVLYSAPDFRPDGIIPFDNNPAAIRLGSMRANNTLYIVYNFIVFYGVAILAFVSIFLHKRNFTAYLAVVGVNAFFLLWEVNPKYLTNFFFVYIFLACITVRVLFDKLKPLYTKARLRHCNAADDVVSYRKRLER